MDRGFREETEMVARNDTGALDEPFLASPEAEDTDDDYFGFSKQVPDQRIEWQRFNLLSTVKRHHGNAANLRPSQNNNTLEDDANEYYKDAPLHFGTVHELVQVVGGYLPDKASVLAAASVNRKWREALLWDGYENDVYQLSVSAYSSNKTKHFARPWVRDISSASWVFWWLVYLLHLMLLVVWITESQGDKSGDSVRKDLLTVAIIFTCIYFLIHVGIGLVMYCIHAAGQNPLGFKRRLCLTWNISLLLAVSSLGFFLMTSVGSELTAIFQRGEDTAVSDSSPWSRDAVFARNTTLVRINNPGSWHRLPDTQMLVARARRRCILNTDGEGDKDEDDEDEDEEDDECLQSITYDTLNHISQAQWQNQGPFNTMETSFGCQNPVQDAYPNRTIFLEVSGGDRVGSSLHQYSFSVESSPTPFGVKNVNLVLLNRPSSSSGSASGATWDLTSLVDMESSTLKDLRWSGLVLYDLALSAPMETALAQKYAQDRIVYRRLSPEQLNKTLAAAPYNLNATHRNSILRWDTLNSTVKLRFWLSRVLGDSVEAANQFSQPQDFAQRNLRSGSKHSYTYSSLDHYKLPHVSWSYVSKAESDGNSTQRWSVHVLPFPAACSYPTLSSNPEEEDDLLNPAGQPAGSFVYAGDKSFWFRGRGHFKRKKGLDAYFQTYPNIPMTGGRFRLPAWCAAQRDATTFFVVSIFLFLLPAVLQAFACAELFWKVGVAQRQQQDTAVFKKHAVRWWAGRTEFVCQRKPGHWKNALLLRRMRKMKEN